MCLAVPAKIVELKNDSATVDSMGNRWNIKTTLLENAEIGDIVLVHAGFAISKVDEDEAEESWKLISEIKKYDRGTEKTP